MLEKKQIAHIWLLLSGVGILIWQIWNTFQAFVEGQTTFSTSQQSFDALNLPSLIICPKKIWIGFRQLQNEVNISDENWHNKQFLILNDALTLTLIRMDPNSNSNRSSSTNLTLGENFDERGKTFFVEKLFNHWYGMCYALTPDQNYNMTTKEYFQITAKVAKKEKIPPFQMYLVDPKNRYEYLLDNLGDLDDPIEVESGNVVYFKIKKIIWNYLLSKRNCKKYDEQEDSYATCLLINQVDCYEKVGPSTKYGCNCVAENAFWPHFHLHPIQNWNICRTNSEYKKCIFTMANCGYNDEVRNTCPSPCQKRVYNTKKINAFGTPTKANEIRFWIEFDTMQIEEHNEVWILETYNFIGTVGGSLGLFIGFSYTGFLGQILDYVFFRNN